MPLAVHCLLHHDGEKFDMLTIAEPAKSEEVCTGLIKMGHDLHKKSEEYSVSIGFADVDDDTKKQAHPDVTSSATCTTAARCGTAVVTVEDSDNDIDDEEDVDQEEGIEEDGVLPSPSEFAARLLLSLGGSGHSSDAKCSSIECTPVNASSSGTPGISTMTPRVLSLDNLRVKESSTPASGRAAGQELPGDDDDIVGMLAQNDDLLRSPDTWDPAICKEKKSTVKQKKVTILIVSPSLCMQ